MVKHVAVLGAYGPSLVRFRGQLLSGMVNRGHLVTGIAAEQTQGVGEALAKMGVAFRSVSMSRGQLSPSKDVEAIGQLIKLFYEIKPDVLLSYTIKPVIYGSIAGKLARIGQIYSLISGAGYAFADGDEVRRRIAKAVACRLYRLALRRNTSVFFQNSDNLNTFIENRIIMDSSRAVLVNGSGVDVDVYKFSLPPEEVSFLLVGRLLADKGVREYAAAVRKIRSAAFSGPCRLVGWFDSVPNAIKMDEVDQWIAEGIEFLGKLDDVRPALRACAVYVLPSYHEGMPRTVLEAMATGRAIITTDAPGCRDTVIHGVNGFLVPPRDSGALAAAMLRFVREPGLVRTMGAASRRIAEEKYDVREVNRVMLEAMGL